MGIGRIERGGKQVKGSTAPHERTGVTERAEFFRRQAERLFKLSSDCIEHHIRDQLLALANEYVALADAAAQGIPVKSDTEPETPA